MAAGLEAELRERGFAGALRSEAPLAPLTTWRIGGPAELLATPRDADDLVRVVRFAGERAIPWRVLGNGSNLLIRDEGVRGLVIRVRKVLDAIRFEGATVEAGAGASFPQLANLAAARGLTGLEFGAGIPGTVGGAIVMNAGWHEFEIGNAVASVTRLEPDGSSATLGREASAFGYRTSAFRGRPGIVLAAWMALAPDDPAAVRARLERFAAGRKATQPTELPSCGSVFLKPEGDFAGRLIEAAGLKGRRVGGIQISPKHANFFVNLGGGTAKDALELVGIAESEVARRFGVALTREFELW